MSAPTTIFQKLFSVREGARSWLHVILWWELRRFVYNALVGLIGFISVAIFIYFASKHPNDFKDGPEPFSIFIFAIIANVCYTGGWIWELVARLLWKEKAQHFGPVMFSLGLLFSMLTAFVPSVGMMTMYCFSKT